MPNLDSPGGGGGGDAKAEACDRTHAKKREQKSENTAWGESGIPSAHRSTIQQVATDEKVVIYFRKTKSECEPWILAKHQPKPHSVLAGTTITGASVDATQAWLDNHYARMHPEVKKMSQGSSVRATSKFYTPKAEAYIGIVASTQAGSDLGKPLQAFGKDYRGMSYGGKWITGDYDLFQVVKGDKKCTPVCQNGEDFARLKKEINNRLKWDAIQHGPQAQWCPTTAELGDLPLFKMPDLVKKSLQTGKNQEVMIAKGRKPMKAIDSPLTVVAGNGVVIALKEEKDVQDALICEGCAE